MTAERQAADGRDRFQELDGLRGIAATWVMIFHLTFGIRVFWLRDFPDQVHKVTPWSGNIEGLLAVDLFFMVSGFVIFMTIGRCQTVWDFVASRFARLYPAFWASMSLTALAATLMPSPLQPISGFQYLVNLTMLQAFVRVEPVEGVYWSLSFEFGFYFLIALAFMAGVLSRIHWLALIWVAISFVVFKLFPEIGTSIPYRLQCVTVLPYANLFYSGILFFKIRKSGPSMPLFAGLIVCFLVQIYGHGLLFVGITAANYAAFTLCVLGYGRVFASKPLVFLGTISYSLYLLHYGIGYRVMTLTASLGLSPWINLAAAIAVNILLASAVTFLVEQPANRFFRAKYRAFTLARRPSVA